MSLVRFRFWASFIGKTAAIAAVFLYTKKKDLCIRHSKDLSFAMINFRERMRIHGYPSEFILSFQKEMSLSSFRELSYFGIEYRICPG